jgi:REP element-mobilizing transposase RayT
VTKLQKLGFRIIACSVGKNHVHALVEIECDYLRAKRTIGKCKQFASHYVREFIAGTIWSDGGSYDRIRDNEHFRNTYDYIRTRQEAGSVVWSHHPDED